MPAIISIIAIAAMLIVCLVTFVRALQRKPLRGPYAVVFFGVIVLFLVYLVAFAATR